MEEAFSGLSTKDDPQSMDTDVCPSPASQCLPYHGSSIYHHPDQEFNRGPHGERTDVVGNGQENVNMEKDEPYSKLIYRALMDTPGHTMVLRDIYQWFKVNTDKTDKETKGWQNSIRHNLSMNGAFDKVEQAPGEDTKKGNMWRLTEEAIREGVKSTTRYRKPHNLIDCPSFPQSPTQDQSWAFNTISDTSVLFTPANGLFGGEPLGVTEFGLTPSESPSLSDADGPPTPTHNPGGLDVDPDGHLAPPAPTNFYEAEGRM
ncbi:Transcription factor fork head [Macrophomina phaseolina MS6]|uniref:Transcription factor fork head n=1 Tax=Macrophomina phaseolina (strain MS6) TaxID=1126212 RepID=K2QTU4_MACPH|nr:Transcription factor fork head [Macrophomina phaseolina MS6]